MISHFGFSFFCVLPLLALAGLDPDLPKKIPSQKKAQASSFYPFPSIYRPEVKYWVDFFSQNPEAYLNQWLERSYRYFPGMKKIFISKGLPPELVAMTLIESSLSAHAVSSAQAVGYWQFIRSTGADFGLRIDDWIDERKDFEKSTKAAAQYLSKLYEEFEDWLLAMSAYNMGERRLRGLIKKHQTSNFWLLRKKPDFPKETSLYIPKILAAVHILKRPAQYGFKDFVVLNPYRYDVFFVPGGSHLKELAHKGLSYKELKSLNPDLKKDYIPKSIPSHPIRIPKGSGPLLSHWLDKKEKT